MNKDILNAIFAKLETISKISEVFKYNKGQIDNYPTAIISNFRGEKERTSVKTIEKKYKYTVKIYQEIKSELRDIEANEDLMLDIVSDIDNAFDTDDSLGGVVDDINCTNAMVFEDRELLMLVAEIEITCLKLKQLT